MGRRRGLRGYVRKWRKSWQVVVEFGEQPFRQCPKCRDEPRADGRRKGSSRWWLADGSVPPECPECESDLIEDVGRRQERIGGFDRKRDAEDELARIIAEDRQGRAPLREDLTMSVWLDRWLDEIIAPSVQIGELSPSTGAGYEAHVRIHLRPRLGHIELRQLTPAHVSNMMRAIQAEGLKAATAVRLRATLSRVLSDAMRRELVHRNVAQIAKPPRIERRTPSAFTVEELERIIEAMDGHRLRAFFLFTAYTGLRASEVRGLRWPDIDFDEGTFQIRRGLHRIGKAAKRVVGQTGLVESKPKTEDSGNELPLSKPALHVLLDQRRDQAIEREMVGDRWVDQGYVFTNTVGSPLEDSNVLREWRAVLKQAGVEYRRPNGRGRGLHELRRTFATRLRDRGVPLEDVQRLGRWSSPQVLLELYSVSDRERLRQAAEDAADAIGGW